MKVELIKRTNPKGEIWFHIIVDGVPKEATQDEQEAYKLFNLPWTEPKEETIAVRDTDQKYTTDGYSVFSGKTEIARAYAGGEVRILQGMNRVDTIDKIAQDCPEFLQANNWDVNKVPKLFSV